MLAEGEDQLGWEHMPDDLVQALETVPQPPDNKSDTAAPAALSLQQLSSTAIDQALQAARGNMSQAARQLGISRQTLYRKLGGRATQ
jgi:transcriptional regulator of acetoin/glycerol metabolism